MGILPLIGIALLIALVVATLVVLATRGSRRLPDPYMWRPGHDSRPHPDEAARRASDPTDQVT